MITKKESEKIIGLEQFKKIVTEFLNFLFITRDTFLPTKVKKIKGDWVYVEFIRGIPARFDYKKKSYLEWEEIDENKFRASEKSSLRKTVLKEYLGICKREKGIEEDRRVLRIIKCTKIQLRNLCKENQLKRKRENLSPEIALEEPKNKQRKTKIQATPLEKVNPEDLVKFKSYFDVLHFTIDKGYPHTDMCYVCKKNEVNNLQDCEKKGCIRSFHPECGYNNGKCSKCPVHYCKECLKNGIEKESSKMCDYCDCGLCETHLNLQKFEEGKKICSNCHNLLKIKIDEENKRYGYN